MKTQSCFGALLCAFFFATKLSIFGQGSLTPPAAPAPTMKTLDQVEPRTPLAGGTNPIFISQPGSYYLAGNLSITSGSGSNGITIYVSNVTIDLNGFELAGSGATSGTGVIIAGGESNVTIRNGTIRNWGSHGINGAGNSKVRAENLRVVNNRANGILADVNAEVLNCVAEANVGIGIKVLDNSIVKDSQAIATTGTDGVGISVGAAGVVTGCVARGNSGNGIETGNRCTLTSCTASNNSDGIRTGDSCTVTASTSVSNFNGFNIQNQCTIVGCTASSNSNVGIYPSNNCTIKDCTASLNGSGTIGDGILAGTGCTISNCTASSNLQYGIYSGDGCIITTCVANDTQGTGIGIRTFSNSTITGCTANGNRGDGIQFNGRCLITGNNSSANGTGGTGHGFHNMGGITSRLDSNQAQSNTGNGFDTSGDLVIRNNAYLNTLSPYSPTPFCAIDYSATPISNPWGNFGICSY